MKNIMRRSSLLAVQHPIIFGFVLFLLFTLLSTITWPITQIKTAPAGYELGTAIAKLTIAGCFLLLLWGFGWLKPAGFTAWGAKRIWFLVVGLIIYRAVFGIYAYTGSFKFELPAVELTLAILFYTFSASLVEESMYRGVLLTAMVKAWGSTRKGLYTAAFLSALVWGSMHFFNLMIRPFPVVGLQVLETVIAGFAYAAIVLSGSSIWPVILFHWAVNATINLQVSQIPGFEETISTGIIFNLTALPMLIVGFILLRKAALQSEAGDQIR
jgi:membrane protease YdiL (CAAX protease family)